MEGTKCFYWFLEMISFLKLKSFKWLNIHVNVKLQYCNELGILMGYIKVQYIRNNFNVELFKRNIKLHLISMAQFKALVCEWVIY